MAFFIFLEDCQILRQQGTTLYDLGHITKHLWHLKGNAPDPVGVQKDIIQNQLLPLLIEMDRCFFDFPSRKTTVLVL